MITAIVIARKGSTRIPGKMHQHIGDKTLLMNKVDQLVQCKHVNEVLVGSDDESIKYSVSKAGAKFVLRDKEYCDEKSVTVNEVVKDMCRHASHEHILWAHPTNPFISTRHYDEAFGIYLKYGSLFCATQIQDHFWFNGNPINHDPLKVPHQVAAEIRPLYRQNGSIFIRPKKDFMKDGRFVGDSPTMYAVDEISGWDINHPWELDVARKLLECGYAVV